MIKTPGQLRERMESMREDGWTYRDIANWFTEQYGRSMWGAEAYGIINKGSYPHYVYDLFRRKRHRRALAFPTAEAANDASEWMLADGLTWADWGDWLTSLPEADRRALVDRVKATIPHS